MILALEAATAACSTALCAADGSAVAESLALDGPAHTQRLLPGVHDVFAQSGAGWDDVDTVAVGLGPGAFTGLRIGVATARALAHADGRVRLAGVSTLTALAVALAAEAPPAAVPTSVPHTATSAPPAATSAHSGRLLVPLIDGKRREVFAAVYAADGGRVRVVEDLTVVPADDLTAWLERRGAAVCGGDGAVLYAGLLPASCAASARVTSPTAAMVGRAVATGAPGVVWGADAVLPLYGRTPDAKRWAPAAAPGSAATPPAAAPGSAATPPAAAPGSGASAAPPGAAPGSGATPPAEDAR